MKGTYVPSLKYKLGLTRGQVAGSHLIAIERV